MTNFALAIAALSIPVVVGVIVVLRLLDSSSEDSPEARTEPSATVISPVLVTATQAVASTPSITSTARPTVPSGTPSSTTSPTPRQYVVKPGDTLTSIAMQHLSAGDNLAAFILEIRRLNGLSLTANVTVGQILIIPQ